MKAKATIIARNRPKSRALRSDGPGGQGSALLAKLFCANLGLNRPVIGWRSV